MTDSRAPGLLLNAIWRVPIHDPYYGWRKTMLLEHLPRLCYSGPLGARKNWNQWDRDFCGSGEYAIYHLFDNHGDALYIGKAWCPLYRFENHRRREWWPDVAHMNLYKVTCEQHRQEPCGDLERITLAWERRAIEMIRPKYNIAGVPKVGAV